MSADGFSSTALLVSSVVQTIAQLGLAFIPMLLVWLVGSLLAGRP